MRIPCYLIALLSLIFTSSALSQSLTGTVKSSVGDPIAGATISVLNRNTGSTADAQGQFTLNLNRGTYQLSINAVGYATQVQTVTIPTAQPLNVVLTNNTQTLGEVVVTASKREEDIVQVPTAITSLSAKKIEDTRTWGLGGLTALVPNYNYQELGVPFQQIQSIRGIQVFSENPAVATYIDDVNQLDILANGFALTDVERIEVLRGPQGTLFGRNAMGGVVNIITRKPTNRTEGFAEVGVGNLALQRHALGFKTPIVKDKLFFGVNGLFQTRNGYWRNDTTGTGAADGRAQGRRVGDERSLYGNAYLRWLPSAQFSATLNVKTQRDWSDNSGFFVSQQTGTEALNNPDRINLARIGQHERNVTNTALTLKYYANKFAMTSISANQTISLSFRDIDFPGFYHSFYESAIGEKLPPQRVLSQEIRLNSTNTASRLQYTAGVFGFTQEGYEPSTNLAFELTPTNFSIFRNRANNRGIALFGELNYQFTSALKATVGLRYDNEYREATFNGFGDASFTEGVVINNRPDTTVSGSYTALSPKLALTYALGNRSSLYATYTRGFRAGGVNAQRVPAEVRQTFDPEFSDNYEVGYKVRSANGRFSLSASAFWIQWRDLQFFNLVAPFTYNRENVGDARSQGLELEVSVIPARGLQLDASLGLNKTAYQGFTLRRVNFVTGVETSTEVTDNRLSNAPSHTLFLAAQYSRPLSGKLTGTVRAELRNLGDYYTDIQNTLRQPAYTLFNARAGLTYGKYSLFGWGQNLTNTRYLAFGTPDTSFGRSVRTAAPVTYGVTLSARF